MSISFQAEIASQKWDSNQDGPQSETGVNTAKRCTEVLVKCQYLANEHNQFNLDLRM